MGEAVILHLAEDVVQLGREAGFESGSALLAVFFAFRLSFAHLAL